MPKQETFFEQENGKRRIEVLKSYDQAYAREAFQNMNHAALQRLWVSLKPEEIYDPAGLPALGSPNVTDGEAEAFLWDELLEQARGNQADDEALGVLSGVPEGEYGSLDELSHVIAGD